MKKYSSLTTKMPWFKKLSQMYVLYGFNHVTVSFETYFWASNYIRLKPICFTIQNKQNDQSVRFSKGQSIIN